MSKAKEINEKTFELNITNELLNLSKSFLWYLDFSPLCYLLPRNVWRDFLSQSTFFAQGLTQKQESDSKSGGYDVSINFKNPYGGIGRLMFLQYKAGIRTSFCKNHNSHFNSRNAQVRDKSHIIFKFNDAAKKTQHSTLRNLANIHDIQAESVMYVFPRITELIDFEDKIGNLLTQTSFVPILDLDKQAKSNSITISDGTDHNYRTSYDGNISEVNYYYYNYHYEHSIIYKFLAELICVQIERFAKLNEKLGEWPAEYFVISITRAIETWANEFFDSTEQRNSNKDLLMSQINTYLELYKSLTSNVNIPQAPQKYTTVVSLEGFNIKIKEKIFSNINYQLF